MKIIHHVDNDGFCAAAIINSECRIPFDVVSNDDLMAYDHGYEIDPNYTVSNGEYVYIVDIALSKPIEDLIKRVLKMGANVVHIDHHKSGVDYWNNLPDDSELKSNQNYKHLFRIGVSSALLSWVYTYMTSSEQLNCDTVDFDFEDDWSHFIIGSREYSIPFTLRYINDRDVWLKCFPETDAFIKGLSLEEDLSPKSAVWDALIYNNWSSRTISEYINKGKVIQEFMSVQHKQILNKAHESNILGVSMICVNSCVDDPLIFEDLLKPIDGDSETEHYAVGCVYHYNGKIRLWDYSFYSDETGPKVNELINELFTSHPGGVVSFGGHEHAAGAQMTRNIFETKIND